ncbi:Hypothetical protein D9617_20g026890 [Elsinoe fawcettii]|nr:Hypothetical protein D9617_20g026890 [Elsinoe fawcettii]
MPPKAVATAAAAGGSINLSQRELDFLGVVFQCMETEPKVCYDPSVTSHLSHVKVDLKKVAQLSTYASAASASNAWRALRFKLGINAVAKKDDKTTTTVPATPVTGGRKRTMKAAGENGGDGSPAKKARGRGGKKEEVKDEESGEEDAPGSPDDQDATGGAKIKEEA